MEEDWKNGLCREFVKAVEKAITMHSKSYCFDYDEIGKDVVDLFNEYFQHNP
jgi:hypothetical protein